MTQRPHQADHQEDSKDFGRKRGQDKYSVNKFERAFGQISSVAILFLANLYSKKTSSRVYSGTNE